MLDAFMIGCKLPSRCIFLRQSGRRFAEVVIRRESRGATGFPPS